MVTLKQILVAATVVVLVAATAAAGDGYWAEPPATSPKKTRIVQLNSTGRAVSVWRESPPGPSKAVPSDPAEENESPFRDDPKDELPPPREPAKSPAPTMNEKPLAAPPVDEKPTNDAPISEVPAQVDPSRVREWIDESSSCGCIDGGCADGCCDMCAQPLWAYRTYAFGEFLYLKPTGIDMAHAIQQNGVGGLGTTPDGQVGVVTPAINGGFRVGFGRALNDCSSIGVTYTNLQTSGTDTLNAPPGVGGTVSSLVLHPNSINGGSTSSLVDATYNVNFQLATLDYRRLLAGGTLGALNYTAGVAYGKLGQQFQQTGQFAPPAGNIQTTTNLTFEGVGFRTGLDGERRIGGSQFSVFSKGFISVLFGHANSNYTQQNLTTTEVQAMSNWANDRVVPLLEYEVGANWTSMNGHWRVAVGYYTAFWFNAVTTPQYVQAVQTSNFANLGQTVAFDGLVTRLEFRF